MMSAEEKLKQRLDGLQPILIEVKNESHLHVTHAEGGRGAHLRLKIISEKFEQLSPLARHRLIYQKLGDLDSLGIHALSIMALTPNQISK